MAFPIWQTDSGSLGTLAENTTVRIELEATGTGITYSLVSGDLPAGLNFLTTGVITGAMAEVVETTTYSFTIRATNADNKITDRSFSITVEGPDQPTFTSNADLLFSCRAGQIVDFQVLAQDTDPGTVLEYSLISGELPTGLRLKSDGKIIGIAGAPAIQVGDNLEDWIFTGPVELVGTYSTTFTLQVTDGVYTSTRTYAIRVEDRKGYTADSTFVTCDSDVATTDSYPDLPPIFLTAPDIGTLRHANYWIYPIRVYDPNQNRDIFFQIVDSTYGGYDNDLGNYDNGNYLGYDSDEGGTTISGITIDRRTGTLKGNLPIIPAIRQYYDILVRAHFTGNDGTYVFSQRTFNFTVKGDIEKEIQWISGTDLGTVIVGNPSQLKIQAELANGTQDIYYKLTKYNLPPGLTLTSNGLITGTTGKRTTEIDLNTTTWDNGTTTLDKVYTFEVTAHNANGTLRDTKVFTITVDQRTRGLFYDYWVKGLVPLDQRETFEEIVNDYSLFPVSTIYRLDDPNFGLNKELRTLIAKGVKSVDSDLLLQAMNLNHGKKNYYFGDIKYAESRNPETNILEYEVVYVELVDPLENVNGSPDLAQAIVRSYGGTEPITADSEIITADNTYLRADLSTVEVVYPNSTANMRYRLDEFLDTIRTGFLPDWMRSVQSLTSDRLGYTKAVVLAYVNPNEGARTVRRLKNVGIDLSSINYQVDRYYVEPIYKYENDTSFDSRVTTWKDLTVDSETLDNKFFVFQRDNVT